MRITRDAVVVDEGIAWGVEDDDDDDDDVAMPGVAAPVVVVVAVWCAVDDEG